MNLNDNINKVNELIKSIEEFEKARKKDCREGHGHTRDGEPMDAANKAEVLSKPPVSEAQRRAMHAAASGKSTLGIPKSVGKEFAAEDKGGKLPEKKDKCDKSEAMSKSTPIVYYDKGDAVGKAHGTHTLGAISKVLSQNYDHEKTKNGNHYFRHTHDKNLTAVVFGQRSGSEDVHPKRREMDKSDVELRDGYDYHPKDGPRYHVHEDGMRVTDHDKPLSLKHINSMYGGVKKLESMGFRLVPHEEKSMDKSIEVYSLNESLEKAIIKPKKPSPASAYSTEYKKPEVKVQDPDTAHGFDYSSGSPVKVKPVKAPEINVKPAKLQSPSASDAHARIQEQKRDEKLVPPKAPTAIETIKEKQKMKKSEIFSKITSEELTKSMRARHSDENITEMLKAAFDEGKIHHNVYLEWQNFKTINPCIVNLLETEE